jgi:hypothetical protein
MTIKKNETRGGKRQNAGRKKTLSKQQYKKLISIGVNQDDFIRINNIKIENNFKNYHQVISYLFDLIKLY